ncbi:PNGase F N-terminal domain-containing protein [Faecalibacter macacae]|uniref:Peptide-N-glycosidase n=1 Tax=Faecalibacter macacae TaxID=1859289 RepID=A0A3L9MHC1_9FLAO|nr:PNGase F N-terminal domain-containing protein [Faecalibacter macacae]RLZ10724.1 peptide-N-glycosidase [Faecalibacter macacae]
MFKILSAIILTCISIHVSAQETYKITYEKYTHQKKISESNPTLVLANSQKTIIGTSNSFDEYRFYPNEITYYTNEEPNNIYSLIQFDSLQTIKTIDTISLKKHEFKKLNGTKKILGLRAKHAQIIINSNTIDLWYVDNINIKAAPNTVGLDLGFVLEHTRNNNYTIRASKIERIKNDPTEKYHDEINLPTLDPLTYKDLVWKSKFITVPLLQNQEINFGNEITSNDSILRFAHGTIAVRKIRLPRIRKGSQIFLDINQISNGDAYDRTGSAFLIPFNKKQSFLDGLKNGINKLPIYENGNGKKYQGITLTQDYEPLIELMRFFTPFGIDKYNYIQIKDKEWHKIASYRQDISEYYDLLNDKEVYIGFFIGNYDKGGHKIDANITIHDSNKQLIPNNKILALFNTTNVMEMAGQEYPTLFNSDQGLRIEFELKDDWKNAKLRYTTTGHGGWENGDEFVPKVNSIFIDDKKVFSLAPWRQDCGAYRLYNPASGNFDNGLSSSDYSRSNWCPGTVTNPYIIELGDLKAGKHTIQVKIPQGETEGGSFSSWAVSGVLLGE